jgi:hypothetical protein
MWQIRPSELPDDMPPMALELFQAADGRLVLFQFDIDRKGRDAEAPWWRMIRSYTRFDQRSGDDG